MAVSLCLRMVCFWAPVGVCLGWTWVVWISVCGVCNWSGLVVCCVAYCLGFVMCGGRLFFVAFLCGWRDVFLVCDLADGWCV